ncbi:MAG TPA: hypothetical protein VGO50_07315 [Pyrinomonadaceae bacterium]|nr:hypothetical protein [Pyrinomonadaceae bacterium]
MLLLILLLPMLALAQHKENSVCSESAKRNPLGDPQPVLTICNQGWGMTALPALRLYLRVFADGTAQYEENPSWKENVAGMDNFRLVKRTFKTSAAQVEEIKRLGAEDDFLSAKGDYPVFQIWTDSGLETTVIFNWKSIYKRTMLKNFQVGNKDSEKNYPGALVALLRVAGEVRNLKGPQPQTPAPLEYKGFLQVGKTYRGKVNFGDAYGMRLTQFPKLPYHHSVMYSWTNVKDFPALDPDKDFGVRTIVFKVANKKIELLRKNHWTTTCTIEIVRVDE